MKVCQKRVKRDKTYVKMNIKAYEGVPRVRWERTRAPSRTP